MTTQSTFVAAIVTFLLAYTLIFDAPKPDPYGLNGALQPIRFANETPEMRRKMEKALQNWITGCISTRDC